MRTYFLGSCLPGSIQAGIAKSGLKKYWLVDGDGLPVGKPFLRRWEVDLHEATIEGEYQIISKPRGRPRKHATEQDRKASHDRVRALRPGRKAYKANWIAKKRNPTGAE